MNSNLFNFTQVNSAYVDKHVFVDFMRLLLDKYVTNIRVYFDGNCYYVTWTYPSLMSSITYTDTNLVTVPSATIYEAITNQMLDNFTYTTDCSSNLTNTTITTTDIENMLDLVPDKVKVIIKKI